MIVFLKQKTKGYLGGTEVVVHLIEKLMCYQFLAVVQLNVVQTRRDKMWCPVM